MYRKEIIYMSLFEDEVKKECIGYLKSEERQNAYQLEVQVKKLPTAIEGNFPIRLQSETGWQESGPLVIKDGAGKWNGMANEAVLKVEIMISDAERIKGESRKEQETVKEKAIKQEKAVAETAPQEEPKELPDEEREPVLRAESMAVPAKAAAVKAAPIKTMPAKGSLVGMPPIKPVSEHKPLYENKWEQLLSTYEQIHPYGDSRIYVKLEPKDFIVLRENYQHLVNNSFLLHGFYNYRYLILGKEGGFYLGVPGVFYEREKMVALMFGFEAFECEGGEAEEGKFGYYLRKVEL
ncbi:MAG: hypothetical protein NC231_11885 [Bacillus sp. (in: Bacteria)]|nr:hypothetical protein [Bacillus sp. (in: firmicutes)]MCM1427475.1 hypothetical protein [Eubacterium sp.]